MSDGDYIPLPTDFPEPKKRKRHGKPFTCATCGRGYSKMGPIMACDICWKAELKRLGIDTRKRKRKEPTQ